MATSNNNDRAESHLGSHIYTSTYAQKLKNGQFQGFVHTVRTRGANRSEQEFACPKERDTEAQALADALALSNSLPGS